MIKFQPAAKFNKDGILVLLDEGEVKKRDLAGIPNEGIRQAVRSVIEAGQFQGEEKELFPVVFQKQVILLAGTGDPVRKNFTTLRVIVRQAALSSYFKKVNDIEVILPNDDAVVRAVVEGILIGAYRWDRYHSSSEKPKITPPYAKTYTLAVAAKKEYQDIVTTCEGVTLARDLINGNADDVDSEHIEGVIKDLIKGNENIAVEILNRRDMAAKGLHLHLAVNQGSRKEPKLIIVKYSPQGKTSPYTAFVGKGITFDTGGLNLKPSGHIETMRCDMSGAAAVVGALKNILALHVKRNALFVVALAENAIGAGAYKPGDVFRGYGGKTVEIGNTDAEGRLVLADAIAYVVKNYKPVRLLDLATLTGACVTALGYDYSGLVSNHDEFANEVIAASAKTDDRVWRLPSYPEISEAIKSEIADLKNVGFPKGAAGALTAAEFLRQFVADTPWVHIDIAGTAFVDGRGRLYYGHGGTGAGVRLLTEYLKSGR